MTSPTAIALMAYDTRSGAVGLEAVRLDMRRHLDGHELPARCVYALEMVLEEWLSNVARHGNAKADNAVGALVSVGLRIAAQTVELRFEDDAAPFDPLARAAPPRPGSLDDAQPGGLGLELMRAMTSGLVYRRDQGRNVLLATVPRNGRPLDT